MNICLVTPASAHSRKGNRVSAIRWARILRGLGHRVVVEQEWSGRRCDLMVALHARHSFASVKRFRRQHPDLPLLLALTGTDLYGDIRTNPRARQSLEMASRLIVLQPMGILELPERLRHKARVIYQSAEKPPGKFSSRKDVFEVGVFGHLRPVKDPFRAAMAARLLPSSSRIRVVHAGGALSEAMKKKARAEEKSNPRYHWVGELHRWKALRLLARCRLMVLSSRMEGGANVLGEAIAASIPVLASRIPGSIGILGPDYPGYFPVGDTATLEKLLERAEQDSEFLRTLQSRLRPLQSLVQPARERRSWRLLLQEASDGLARPPQTSRLAASPPVSAPTRNKRFTLIDCGGGSQDNSLANEVRSGLLSHPKRLSSRFFYDRQGSQLFEAICELPEYYLTRVERGILQERAGEIASLFHHPSLDEPGSPAPSEVLGWRKGASTHRRIATSNGITLLELGSGSAAKTRILIGEFLRRHATLRYVPVDISRTMLEESSQDLLKNFPKLEILAIAGEYHDALPHLNSEAGRAKLILWLGSNVGNLDRPEAASFLRSVRQAMSSEDRLLVGIDLRKDRATLEKAYDDSAGITARFNRNILARINRELGGRFPLETFKHRAVYNQKMGRVEMYLVSTLAQRVRIERLNLEVPFAAGEQVHTENSYKYSLAEISDLAAAAGLRLERQWLDASRRFSVNLFARTR